MKIILNTLNKWFVIKIEFPDPVPIQSIKASVSKQKVTTDKTPLSNGLNNLNRSVFPRKNNSRDLNTAADQTASTSSQKPTAMASTSKGNSSKSKEENITNANGAIPRAKRIERQHPGNDSKDKVKNSRYVRRYFFLIIRSTIFHNQNTRKFLIMKKVTSIVKSLACYNN